MQAGNQKQLVWQQRLERFRASGFGVARFCRHECVSVNTFYYWAKRLRQVGATAAVTHGAGHSRQVQVVTAERGGVSQRRGAAELGGAAERGGAAKQLVPRAVQLPANVAAESSARVHIRWSSAVQVSIPVGCLEAIRCVMQCLQPVTAEQSITAAQPVSAEQSVISAQSMTSERLVSARRQPAFRRLIASPR